MSNLNKIIQDERTPSPPGRSRRKASGAQEKKSSRKKYLLLLLLLFLFLAGVYIMRQVHHSSRETSDLSIDENREVKSASEQNDTIQKVINHNDAKKRRVLRQQQISTREKNKARVIVHPKGVGQEKYDGPVDFGTSVEIVAPK